MTTIKNISSTTPTQNVNQEEKIENNTAEKKLQAWAEYAANTQIISSKDGSYDISSRLEEMRAKSAEIKSQKQQAENQARITNNKISSNIQTIHSKQIQAFVKDFQKSIGIDMDFQLKERKTYSDDGTRKFYGYSMPDKNYYLTVEISADGTQKYSYIKIAYDENGKIDAEKNENIGIITIDKQENDDGEVSYICSATNSNGLIHSDVINDISEMEIIDTSLPKNEQIEKHIQNFQKSLGIEGEFRVTSVTKNPDDNSEIHYASTPDGKYSLRIEIKANGSQNMTYELNNENGNSSVLGKFEISSPNSDDNTTYITGEYPDGIKYHDTLKENYLVRNE